MDAIIVIVTVIGLVIGSIVASFIIGGSGAVISVLTTGRILIDNGIDFGHKLVDDGGPIIIATIMVFIIVVIIGRISYQTLMASSIYFFSGVSVIVLTFAHPKDVKLAFIIATIASVAVGIFFALGPARWIELCGNPIGYYNITKKAPLVGTIVGFIPVLFITGCMALNMLLNYAEMEDILDYMVDDTYVMSDFAKDCYKWALLIGVICAVISVGIGILLEKNKESAENYY